MIRDLIETLMEKTDRRWLIAAASGLVLVAGAVALTAQGLTRPPLDAGSGGRSLSLIAEAPPLSRIQPSNDKIETLAPGFSFARVAWFTERQGAPPVFGPIEAIPAADIPLDATDDTAYEPLGAPPPPEGEDDPAAAEAVAGLY